MMAQIVLENRQRYVKTDETIQNQIQQVTEKQSQQTVIPMATQKTQQVSKRVRVELDQGMIDYLLQSTLSVMNTFLFDSSKYGGTGKTANYC